MNKSADVFRNYFNSRSQFFILKSGEQKKVKFLSAEEVVNHFFAAKTTEHQRKQRGTNKDHKHHAGYLQGGIQYFAQPLNAEFAGQHGMKVRWQ